MATLSLDSVVRVNLKIQGSATQRSSMNTALFLSKNTVISKSDRVKEYTSLQEMQTGGFEPSSAEYKAAAVYFAQAEKPAKVCIGMVESEEDWGDALKDCRLKNTDWYVMIPLAAEKADIVKMAPLVEAFSPAAAMMYETKDADAKAGTTGNVFETLKTAAYRKSMGIFSTTGNIAAAVAGYAMGAQDGSESSAYTLFGKPLAGGVKTEDLTAENLAAIEEDNGNAYVNRGVYYNLFEKGVMASGVFWDEVYYLDILSEQLIRAFMDLLQSVSKIPQTAAGMAMIQTALVAPLEEARTVGFIAPGVWNGGQVGNLADGTALASGYNIQIGRLEDQSQADREARKAPPVTICIKLAGSVQSVVIDLNVNR